MVHILTFPLRFFFIFAYISLQNCSTNFVVLSSRKELFSLLSLFIYYLQYGNTKEKKKIKLIFHLSVHR